MKKLAAVFVIAVLVPAIGLAWLATRSLRNQEIVVHSQRALLHQGATDALADDFNIFLDDVRSFYGVLLERLLSEVGTAELTENYDQILRSRWSQAGVGAAVSDEGDWFSPAVTSTDPEVRRFLRDTQAFLLNSAPSEVYLAPATAGNVVTVQEWASADGYGSPAPVPNLAVPAASPRPTNEPESAPASKEPLALGDTASDPFAAITPEGQSPAMPTDEPLPPEPETEKPQPGAAAPSPVAAVPVMIQQQKVAINEDRYRNHSNLLRQSQVDSDQTADTAPQGLQRRQATALPNPQGETASEAAEEPTLFADEIAQEAAPGSFLEASSQEALASNQPTTSFQNLSPLNRTRNVTPLGQLDHLQQGGQYFRLAQAANDALAGNPNRLSWSTLDVNTGQLREIMAGRPEGAISRFVSGGLQILLWRRDPAAPGLVFWVQLDVEEIKSELTAIIRETAESMGNNPEVSLALLDASGQVVAQTREGFETDWRRPFVATEVGEILPHWEVAAYLVDPKAVARSARSARLTLWLLVPILLTAIGIGGLLIIRDIGREMNLARQKTDFVSNVSHELKTPLTSIRMFSDLLGNRADIQDTKRVEYSDIISREAARLSRLINNLLDFSRMERGEKRYRKERFPLRDFVTETIENYRHQIESDGFQLHFSNLPVEEGPAEIEGDRDALAQVLVNLLSNAEKYGGETREIDVAVTRQDGTAEIAVMDRGPGVSRKNATRIFEKFYRVDDSLSSGIEGSGLGLTLARQIARAHGGEVSYGNRSGGGSRFCLRLPLTPTSAPVLASA